MITATIGHAEDEIDEIVVTSSRAPEALELHIGNVAVLQQQDLVDAAHAHVHELLTRVPGAWITRGSGQESLPSIRSPVLTGPGSCGAFLTLEDGIPSRPNGFCNVNQLFELPTELARSVEVIRGPGSALYGSNALHGTVNVLMPDPFTTVGTQGGLELGANKFVRVDGVTHLVGSSPVVLGFVAANDGGFRDDSGYLQFKAFAKKSWTTGHGNLTASLSVSDLDQETAGFIIGEDAYRNPTLNRQNLNPEAYRDANSQRLSLQWSRPGTRYDVDVRSYVRRTEMEFLQHFLPGKPLEENGHTSLGVLANARRETDRGVVTFGVDVDVADVFLRETQDGPTEGSAFLVETRPEGKHYDYDVLGISVAAYVRAEFSATPRLTLSVGMRAEHADYDYDNNMLVGNTRDDGAECGFGGCLYTRPASRSDSFSDLAPKIGAIYRVSDATSLFINFARGFRAPQMTELYRLQSGQLVSDVGSETIDSVEVGLRSQGDGWRLDGAAFAMHKKDSVYRDAEGFNVSGGRSTHEGIELSWDSVLVGSWRVEAQGTYARHRYDFDVVAARGETFVSGRDVDTAPRWQGSAEISYDGQSGLDAGLQWVALGSYYLDAENRLTYPGHDVVNLRVSWMLTDRWSVTARLNNVADAAYADRADYAFGNYRYFPGRGRELFLRLRYAGAPR